MKIKYLAIASSLALLASCGDNSLTVSQAEVRPDDVVNAQSISRIQYSPGEGLLPIPNDLLFSGTTDGTLEMPDEVAAKDAGETPDFSDPAIALGALDGWSTQMPMVIPIDLAEGLTLDTSTIGATTVYIVETVTGGSTTCPDAPSGVPCAPVAALTYGVDYVVSSTGSNIIVVPLKPLKAATTYVVAVSNDIQDSSGTAIAPAPLYGEVARDDITITDATLGPLQGAINAYEGIAAATVSRDQSDFIYSAAWTTQSAGSDLAATIQTAQSAMVNISDVASTGVTVETLFISEGLLPAAAAGTTPLALANLHTGSITVPYYLATPSAEDPMAPITTNWMALCDSGATLAAVTDFSVLTEGPNHATCQAISSSLGDYGLDDTRHITKFNPVPQMRSLQTLDVQITTPVTAGPWPVAILQHGITSKKEDMLAATGAFAAAGFATFAIDHPLHGSRGFDLDGDDVDDINATTVDATHYMNLANLLVGRDNLKQSVADMLALRLALASGISGDLSSTDFDLTNVHFNGLSLGGITGVTFVAVANANSLPIQAGSYSAPGGGIAPVLIESQSFGNLVQASVLAGLGTDLSTDFLAAVSTPPTDCQTEDILASSTALAACVYPFFVADITTAGDVDSLTELQTGVASFALAAQTVLDSADPNNFAAINLAAGTPTYMAEIVGDGDTVPSDTVIPNQTQNYVIGGTEPLANYLGLSQVDGTVVGATSGLVKFTQGSHGTYLDPTASQDATTEMQTQISTFHAAGVINVTNDTVVEAIP